MLQLSPLILASGSAARKTMLRNAGLQFQAIPADIDEVSALKTLQKNGQSPQNIAAALAQQKAQHVAAQISAAKTAGAVPFVIGADQILCCEGRLYSKAKSESEAAQILRELRGRTHELITAVCVIQQGKVVWLHHDIVRLAMKEFDEDFLARYMAAAGHDVLLGCVGCYALEGAGAWLFDRIEGDFFTVLGLPLLPLLQFLRTQGFAPCP